LEKIWPAAQEKFIGEAWAATQADWHKRRAAAQSKAAEAPKAPEPAHERD
jgi:hypothetical protein